MAAVTTAVAVGLALLAAAPSNPPTLDESGRGAARHSFAEAERAFSAEEYDRALVLFREAFATSPHPVVRFNIGVCLERLGRFREAREEYLAAAQEPSLSAGEQQQAEASAARLEHHLGWLVLEGADPGGEVVVDAERTCTLPCRLPVDPGRHTVVARLGGTAVESVVELQPGETQRLRYGGSRPSSHPGSSVPTTASPPASAPRPVMAERSGEASDEEGPAERGLSLLTWGGAGIGLLGLTGVAVFGARALWLHDRYLRAPTASTRDEGVLMRDLANISIGVAALGALLVGVDGVLLATASRDDGEAP